MTKKEENNKNCILYNTSNIFFFVFLNKNFFRRKVFIQNFELFVLFKKWFELQIQSLLYFREKSFLLLLLLFKRFKRLVFKLTISLN